jgi:1,3-beta-glucan synthase
MSFFNSSIDSMEFQDAQKFVIRSVNEITSRFQKVPGSAMLIRYIQSSYQDDPVRSAIELVLVIFFVRYLLSPSYSTKDGNFVKLTEEVRLFLAGDEMNGKGRSWTDGMAGNR